MLSPVKSHVYDTFELTGQSTVGEVYGSLDEFVGKGFADLSEVDLRGTAVQLGTSEHRDWAIDGSHSTLTIESAQVPSEWNTSTFAFQRAILYRGVRTHPDSTVVPEGLIGMDAHLVGARYDLLRKQSLPARLRDTCLPYILAEGVDNLPAMNVKLDELTPRRRGLFMARALRIMNTTYAVQEIAEGRDPKLALAPLRKRV